MYQAFGSLCSIMIQTHNNSMSALIGFGKTTHDLKNRRASGWHLNLGRSPVPGNCSERKMVGMWWGQCSSSPGAISSHTPASLSCSVVKFELSKSWKLLWVLVVLVFVPSFKAFFVSCFVAMLCTITRDNGNTCSVKAQEGRWVKVLQKSFLPDCFQMCRSPLSERIPAYQSAGSWRHHHGDLHKGQRPRSTSPCSVGVTPGLSSLQHRRSSSGQGWAGTDPSGLSQGVSVPSHCTSLLWVRAELVWLPCRTQLKCWAQGLENEENKLKRRAKLMFLLTAERPCT